MRNKEIERSSDLATFCLHESHLDFDSRLLSQSRLTEHQPGGRVCVSIPREQGRRRDRCKICFQSSSPWVKLCLLELPAQEQPVCSSWACPRPFPLVVGVPPPPPACPYGGLLGEAGSLGLVLPGNLLAAGPGGGDRSCCHQAQGQ